MQNTSWIFYLNSLHQQSGFKNEGFYGLWAQVSANERPVLRSRDQH